MNIRIFALMILALLTISSAHAESYTFTNSTSFTPAEYVTGSNSPAPVTTRTQSISGTAGAISDLNISINDINCGGLMDMTLVIVGPNNTGVVLASHAGNFSGGFWHYGNRHNDSTITFDDQEASKIWHVSSRYMAWHHATPAGGTYQTSTYLNVPDWYYNATPNYTDYYVGDREGWREHYYYSSKDIAARNPVEDCIFTGVDFAETNLLSAFNNISANGY